MTRDMTEIMEAELRKIRNYKRYRFYDFVRVEDIDAARTKLEMSGTYYRTEKVVRNNIHIGYNIFIEA